MVEQVIFIVFAAIALLSAVMAISFRNSVRAVLSLILCFVATAGVWMMMQAEFLSLALIVVYVGAVMVLFLFVVMMLDVDEVAPVTWVRYWPIAVVVSLLFIILLMGGLSGPWITTHHYPVPPSLPESYSSIKVLGLMLYTDYLYPFEIAGVLLLMAMVAAITLTYRSHRKSEKRQKIADQINTDPRSRIKMLKLDQQGLGPLNKES